MPKTAVIAGILMELFMLSSEDKKLTYSIQSGLDATIKSFHLTMLL